MNEIRVFRNNAEFNLPLQQVRESITSQKFELLTVENDPKTSKGAALGYLTGVLYLAPADTSGREVCPFRTAGCTAVCLNTAGRGGMSAGNATFAAPNGVQVPDNAVQRARIRRTNLYFTSFPMFALMVIADILRVITRAEKLGLRPAIRLNGTSDIDWTRRIVATVVHSDGSSRDLNIFELFPGVEFYDYSKNPLLIQRFAANLLPRNYHVTASWSERVTLQQFAEWLDWGVNVAVPFKSDSGRFGVQELERVFEKSLRTAGTRFHGPLLAINGDESDLRFLDGRRGVMVALKAKGRARKDRSGFVCRID